LNAAIYGLAEPSLAPLEDLVLSFKEFKELCKEGLLKPSSLNLAVKSHLRLWGKARVTGHVEIAGFFENMLLRVALGEAISAETLAEDWGGYIPKKDERSLLELVKRRLEKEFPGCKVTTSPSSGMHAASEDGYERK